MKLLHRSLVFIVLLCMCACSWIDETGSGDDASRFNRSPARLASGLSASPSSSASTVVNQLKKHAAGRTRDVNYSDVIDPTRTRAAQISPSSAQQINNLVLSGQLKSVADKISKCQSSQTSGNASSCAPSTIQKQINDLTKFTSRIANKFSDPRISKSLNTVCSQCQSESKSRRLCVNGKTNTQTCPSCGQILNAVKSFNAISSYMRDKNISHNKNQVQCSVAQ